MKPVQCTPGAELSFVCPRCKGDLAWCSSFYRCERCKINYPVLFGIPDFRLRPDRYLSLEDEREKARRLHEFGKTASFEELVQFYYSITYDLPLKMALRYQAAIVAAPERARHIVRDLAPKPETDILLDIGCGTGGVLVSAQGRYRAIYGVDIALRWLVVCQKRLHDQKASATLVCADAEALPFPDRGFTHAVAADLVEHVYDIDNTLEEIGRTLKPGARFWLSAVNRYCIGPHPLAGVWAVGFLPQSLRAWFLTVLKGIDLLRYANMVSAGDLVARLQRCGLLVLEIKPKHIETGVTTGYGALERGLIELYRNMVNLRTLRGVLVRIGPAFEITCRKTDERASTIDQ